jgi:hypothetical protein
LLLLSTCSWATPSSLFCFSYSSEKVSCFLPQASLAPPSSWLCLPSIWDYICESLLPAMDANFLKGTFWKKCILKGCFLWDFSEWVKYFISFLFFWW